MIVLTPQADRLVRSHLDDLARMLEPAPPLERAEILEANREHIEAALSPTAQIPARQGELPQVLRSAPPGFARC